MWIVWVKCCSWYEMKKLARSISASPLHSVTFCKFVAVTLSSALIYFTLIKNDIFSQTVSTFFEEGNKLTGESAAAVVVDASASTPETDEELVLQASSVVRSIPLPPSFILAVNGSVNSDGRKNLSCARFPTFHDIEFSNTHWQTLKTNTTTFYLYAAYLDTRRRQSYSHIIRVLAAVSRDDISFPTFCQLWFEDEIEPVFSQVREYLPLWPRGNAKTIPEPGRTDYGRPDKLYPYLISCSIPTSHWKRVPLSVSLVREPCDAAKNNIRLLFDAPQNENKKGFAVCHKSLDFQSQDISVRLVEWIELLRALGAEKIFFYEFTVHPNVSKVLRYYEKTGFIEVTPLDLPGGLPNEPRLRRIYLRKKVPDYWLNHPLAYNDCLYRNLYQYKYIAIFDVDEVIMPLKSPNWDAMMKDIKKSHGASKNFPYMSYTFRNIYFMDHMIYPNTSHSANLTDVPKYFHMLQHVHRSQKPLNAFDGPKSILDTNHVIAAHNHYPLHSGGYIYFVPIHFGQVQHYRKKCLHVQQSSLQCANTSVYDANILRFKAEVVPRGTQTLKSLKLIT